MSVCHSPSRLLSCFKVSWFLTPPSLPRNPINWVDLCMHYLMLTRPLSSNGRGMLGFSFHGHLDIGNSSPLFVARFMSLLLTYYALYVCQDMCRWVWADTFNMLASY